MVPPLPVDRPAQVNRAEIDALLVAAGRGDLGAFATFYDRTVDVVFGLLQQDLGPRAELATTQVYLRVWRTASGFDPASGSAHATVLITACEFLTAARVTACRQASQRSPNGTGLPARLGRIRSDTTGHDRTRPDRGDACPTASYR